MELACISRYPITIRHSFLQLVRWIHLSSRPCFLGKLQSNHNVTSPMYNNALLSSHLMVWPHESRFRHHVGVREMNTSAALQASKFLKNPKTSLESKQLEHILIRESTLRDTSARQYRGISKKHGFPLNTSSCVTLCPLMAVIPHHFFSMKRKNYIFPELKADDLEEMYVRGSGPGGQSVNQTSNCVVLKHKPTGIVVKCHETRSLEENKKIARRKLEEKIDLHLQGDKSFLSQVEEDSRQNKQEKKRRANKRLALKRAFKEQENSE
ncbi:unnamed protein product [Lymnaea stagnalis]|uniref:Prokaryotic-type class I peptide chain release factors domain-containing protein n=1 Tax=Lymnaea stagnalis TaxID=6523 RepID=A0AAV2HNU1_LYMST